MDSKPGQAVWGRGEAGRAPTAFRLEVGDAVHDDVVEEEGLVVHLDAAGQETTEVMDVPKGGQAAQGQDPQRSTSLGPPAPNHPGHRGKTHTRTHLFWDGCPTGTTLSS